MVKTWWRDHTWKYVVRDYKSCVVLHVTFTWSDARAYARLHSKLNPDTLVQVRRVSTWWHAGTVLGTWMFDGRLEMVDW